MNTHARTIRFLMLLVPVALLLVGCEKKPTPGPFCGAWKMISGTYKGPNFTVDSNEENRICYKVLSQDHFAVVEMFKDKPDSLLFTAVGSYTFDDSTYTEYYEATNVPYQTGTKNVFRYKLDGDTWEIHMVSEDMELHEVWKRLR